MAFRFSELPWNNFAVNWVSGLLENYSQARGAGAGENAGERASGEGFLKRLSVFFWVQALHLMLFHSQTRSASRAHLCPLSEFLSRGIVESVPRKGLAPVKDGRPEEGCASARWAQGASRRRRVGKVRRMSQSSNGVSERAGRAIRPLGDFGVSKMPELPGHAPDSAGAQMAAEKCDHTHRSGTEAGRGWAPWRGTDRQTDRGRERALEESPVEGRRCESREVKDPRRRRGEQAQERGEGPRGTEHEIDGTELSRWPGRLGLRAQRRPFLGRRSTPLL